MFAAGLAFGLGLGVGAFFSFFTLLGLASWLAWCAIGKAILGCWPSSSAR